MSLSFSTLFLLSIALSMDTFLAGLSYGAEGVRVPLFSKITLSLLSALMLGVSLSAGESLTFLFSENALRLMSFLILFLLALYKLYEAFHARHHFTTDSIAEKVNHKDVHILSPKEAALLGVILSLDSVSAGVSISFRSFCPFLLFLFSGLIHFTAISLGLLTGRAFMPKNSSGFSLISAALFFLLALMRLF